ncbi:MAG: TraR/DksA family transcriptional regulator [Phycisphaeraceae bacterium]
MLHVVRKKMSKKKTTTPRPTKAAKSKASKTKATRSKATGSSAGKKTAKRTTRKKTAAKTATRTTARAGKAKASGAASQPAPKPTSAKKSTSRTKKAATPRAMEGAAKAGKAVMGKEANTNGHAHATRNGNYENISVEQLRKVKSGLTKKDLANFRQLLLEKRAELIGDVESLQSDTRNGGGGISYEHMADVGTDSYEQEFALGLAESERKILQEIDEALGRMSEGFYGICVESGKPIGKPRLEIKPWAKYCIEVARDREKHGLS